jgi:hypothetical protein
MTLQEQINALKAENEALKAKVNKPQKLTLKVSTAGALSIYGMGRFPVTLYKEQWIKVLGLSEEIKAFIVANDAALKVKG